MPQSKDNCRQGHDKIFYLSELVMSRTNSYPNRVAKQYHCKNLIFETRPSASTIESGSQ